MSTPENDFRDWVELMLLKMREGEAMADEVTRLRELLMRDAGARRVYLRSKQTECLLETVPAQQVATVIPASTTAMRRWRVFALASAAAAVIALGFLTLSHFGGDAAPSGRDATVAVLRSSFEAVIDGREVLPGDMPMRAGTYKLERGSVQLRFAKGANVVIEGPALFDLVDASTMHLNQGSLWAHCPEEARGFAVRMPGGRELVDFGTEFGARVDAGGGAQVKVMQGEVKIRDAVARTLDLTEGEAANWEVTAPPLAVNAASVKPFQSLEMLAAKVKSAPSADQQTVVTFRDPAGGEWNQSENWSSDALPGEHALERAVINQGRVVHVGPGLRLPAHPVDVHVSNGFSSVAENDGTLELAGDFQCQVLRIGTADGASGAVLQRGCVMTVTASLFASSHQGGASLRSHYSLADGALHVGHVMALGAYGVAEFTLEGSAALVTGSRMELGPQAILRFRLGFDGAGIVKLRDTLILHPQARLIVDGSGYHGGTKTIPLIVSGVTDENSDRFISPQVSFEGFKDVVPSLAQRSGRVDLVLERGR